MKLFCDLLTRRRSNKKKETVNLLPSPTNILSNNAMQPINQFTPTCLFDKQTRCTCHYFINDKIIQKNFNGNYLPKNVHPSSPRPLFNITPSSEVNYILTITDFCFWYDVRSTLLDIIDRVVTMDETRHSLTQQIPRTIIKFCLPQTNTIHRRIRRPKTSIAIQTSTDYEQRRNAKVQANTLTLFPLQKQNLSSAKLFLN